MPNRHNRRSAYISPAEARKRRQDRAGLALMAGCALGFAALFGSAHQHDSRIAAERAEAAKLEAARIEGVNGSAEIMGAIAGELRKAGCQVRVDSPSSYEVESC